MPILQGHNEPMAGLQPDWNDAVNFSAAVMNLDNYPDIQWDQEQFETSYNVIASDFDRPAALNGIFGPGNLGSEDEADPDWENDGSCNDMSVASDLDLASGEKSNDEESDDEDYQSNIDDEEGCKDGECAADGECMSGPVEKVDLDGKLQMAPTIEAAQLVLADISLVLRPPTKDSKGYHNTKLNLLLQM